MPRGEGPADRSVEGESARDARTISLPAAATAAVVESGGGSRLFRRPELRDLGGDRPLGHVDAALEPRSVPNHDLRGAEAPGDNRRRLQLDPLIRDDAALGAAGD